MKVEEFLLQFIDGYLFGDLRSMSKIKPDAGDGGCGYPMFMTCAAGIEMLGILCGPSTFEAKPQENFHRYWMHYLYPDSPRLEARVGVYQLLRHGVAHNFAAKRPISVIRGQAAAHLTTTTTLPIETFVDADQLFADLADSYENRFKPVVRGMAAGRCGDTAVTMQACLDDLEKQNFGYTLGHGAALVALPAPTWSPTGVSGSFSPGTIINTSKPPGT